MICLQSSLFRFETDYRLNRKFAIRSRSILLGLNPLKRKRMLMDSYYRATWKALPPGPPEFTWGALHPCSPAPWRESSPQTPGQVGRPPGRGSSKFGEFKGQRPRAWEVVIVRICMYRSAWTSIQPRINFLCSLKRNTFR